MRAELKFQPSILLTGPTGLFGRACLPHLIARNGAKQILALVRWGRDTSELTAMEVRSIEVDLGLSSWAYREVFTGRSPNQRSRLFTLRQTSDSVFR